MSVSFRHDRPCSTGGRVFDKFFNLDQLKFVWQALDSKLENAKEISQRNSKQLFSRRPVFAKFLFLSAEKQPTYHFVSESVLLCVSIC